MSTIETDLPSSYTCMYTKSAYSFPPFIFAIPPSMASYRSECAMTVATSTDTHSNVGNNVSSGTGTLTGRQKKKSSVLTPLIRARYVHSKTSIYVRSFFSHCNDDVHISSADDTALEDERRRPNERLALKKCSLSHWPRHSFWGTKADDITIKNHPSQRRSCIVEGLSHWKDDIFNVPKSRTIPQRTTRTNERMES